MSPSREFVTEQLDGCEENSLPNIGDAKESADSFLWGSRGSSSEDSRPSAEKVARELGAQRRTSLNFRKSATTGRALQYGSSKYVRLVRVST
jgi:hypothetical protein